MTIKLNEFDKKLLSSVKPSDSWNKLKHIYSVNSIVKQLKIGSKKIGTKCAKHLQKIAKKDKTDINEIKDGCKDLIKKKPKNPLAKSKEKREVLKSHKINKTEQLAKDTKQNVKAIKPQSTTDKFLSLLLQQQQQQQKMTIQRNVAEVDRILTDKIKTPELPQTAQRQPLQLKVSPPIVSPAQPVPISQAFNPAPSVSSSSSDLQQNVQQNVARASYFRDLNSIQQGRLNLKNRVRSGEFSAGQAFGILSNIKSNMIRKNIRGIVTSAPENESLLATLDDIQSNIDNDLQDYQSAIPQVQDKSGAFRSLTNKLTDKKLNQEQDNILSGITELGRKQRGVREEQRLGLLQGEIMGHISGRALENVALTTRSEEDQFLAPSPLQTPSRNEGSTFISPRPSPLSLARELSGSSVASNKSVEEQLDEIKKNQEDLKTSLNDFQQKLSPKKEKKQQKLLTEDDYNLLSNWTSGLGGNWKLTKHGKAYDSVFSDIPLQPATNQNRQRQIKRLLKENKDIEQTQLMEQVKNLKEAKARQLEQEKFETLGKLQPEILQQVKKKINEGKIKVAETPIPTVEVVQGIPVKEPTKDYKILKPNIQSLTIPDNVPEEQKEWYNKNYKRYTQHLNKYRDDSNFNQAILGVLEEKKKSSGEYSQTERERKQWMKTDSNAKFKYKNNLEKQLLDDIATDSVNKYNREWKERGGIGGGVMDNEEQKVSLNRGAYALMALGEGIGNEGKWIDAYNTDNRTRQELINGIHQSRDADDYKRMYNPDYPVRHQGYTYYKSKFYELAQKQQIEE